MAIYKKRPGMVISLIAAMASNRVIGNRGDIPWKIPTELSRFKSITMGHTVIMGRKTYESIGHALPGRINIVLTSNMDYCAPGCVLARDLPSAIEICPQGESEIFVCGGEQVYKEALLIADRIYLSVIHREISGDVFFPEIPFMEFIKIRSEYHEDIIPYTLSIYERIDS
ncbi:MAG: dihydrofolate reductase [Candidatus Brocadia sp.]|nr:dihydrofolate reductase [Candidatus Brocadia sp.]